MFKKSLILFSSLALVACSNIKKEELQESAVETTTVETVKEVKSSFGGNGLTFNIGNEYYKSDRTIEELSGRKLHNATSVDFAYKGEYEKELSKMTGYVTLLKSDKVIDNLSSSVTLDNSENVEVDKPNGVSEVISAYVDKSGLQSMIIFFRVEKTKDVYILQIFDVDKEASESKEEVKKVSDENKTKFINHAKNIFKTFSVE